MNGSTCSADSAADGSLPATAPAALPPPTFAWFRASSFKPPQGPSTDIAFPESVPLTTRQEILKSIGNEDRYRARSGSRSGRRSDKPRKRGRSRDKAMRHRSSSLSEDRVQGESDSDRKKRRKKKKKSRDKKKEARAEGGAAAGGDGREGRRDASSRLGIARIVPPPSPSSSDWDDDEDMTGGGSSALSLVLSGHRAQSLVHHSRRGGGGAVGSGSGIQVVHLPNGDILAIPISESNPYVVSDASLFSMDRRGDLALAELGSAYRLDIPLYDIVLQARDMHPIGNIMSPYRLRWDELAIQNQVLPSGVSIPPPEPARDATRSVRYFASGPGAAQTRALVTPRYRFRDNASTVVASRKRAAMEGGDVVPVSRPSASSSFLPLAPDDLLSPASEASVSASVLEAGLGSAGASNGLISDAAYFQARYASVSKQFNSKLRSSGADVSAWLQMCAVQAVLAELQELGSGNATRLFRRGVVFEGSSTDYTLALSIFAHKVRSTGLSSSLQSVVHDRTEAILTEAVKNFEKLHDWASQIVCYIELLKLYHSRQGSLEGEEARQAELALRGAASAARAPWIEPLVYIAVAKSHFVTFTMPSLRSKFSDMMLAIRREVDNKAAAEALMLSTIAGGSSNLSGHAQWRSILDHSSLVAFSQLCSIETEAGHREKVIALVQALIDLNLEVLPFLSLRQGLSLVEYTCQGRIAEQESRAAVDAVVRCWDSEAPRLGDLRRFVADETESSIISRKQEGSCRDLSVLFRQADLSDAPSLMPTGTVAWIMQGEPKEGFADMNVLCFTEAEVNIALSDAPADSKSAAGDQTEIPLTESYEKENKDFAASFLNAWIKEQEAIESSDGARSDGTDDAKPSDEDEYVYSAMHGYKIKKIRVADSSAEYKKILNDIKGTEDNLATDHPSKYKIDSTKISASHQFPDSVDVKANRFSKYFLTENSMSCQFYPLRIQSDGLQDAVSRQPERVVFGEDLRPHLFAVSASPSSLPSLLVVCLGALGLKFPFCRVVSPSFADPLNQFRMHPIAPSSCVTSSLLDVLDDRLGNDLFLRELVLLFSTGNASISCPSGPSWALVDREVLLSHISAVRQNMMLDKPPCDSPLSFCIRFIARILFGSERVVLAALLDEVFIGNLSGILLQLLFIRHVIRSAVAGNPFCKDGPSLQEFRSNCLWVIQRTEAAAMNIDNSAAHSSSYSSKMAANVLVLDSYCLCESTLSCLSHLQVGGGGNSFKLLEKTLRAVAGAVLDAYPPPQGTAAPHLTIPVSGAPAVPIPISVPPQRSSRFGSAPALVDWASQVLLDCPGFAALLWHFVENAIISSVLCMPHDKGEVFSAAIHNLMLVHEIICNGRFVPLKELAKRARSSHTSDAKSAGLQGLAKILSEIIQARLDTMAGSQGSSINDSIRLSGTPNNNLLETSTWAYEIAAAPEAMLGVNLVQHSASISAPSLCYAVQLAAWASLLPTLQSHLAAWLNYGSVHPASLEAVARDAVYVFDSAAATISATIHSVRRCAPENIDPNQGCNRYTMHEMEACLLKLNQDRVETLLNLDSISGRMGFGLGMRSGGRLRSSLLSRRIEDGLQFSPNDTYLLSALLHDGLHLSSARGPESSLSRSDGQSSSASLVQQLLPPRWIAQSERCGLVAALTSRSSEPGIWSPMASGRLKHAVQRIISGYEFFCGMDSSQFIDLNMVEVIVDVHRAVAASIQKANLRVDRTHSGTSECSRVYLWDQEDFDRVCDSFERLLGTAAAVAGNAAGTHHFASSRACAQIWCVYVDITLARGAYANARRLLYRAVRHCPGSKALWLRAFLPPMQLVMSEKELMDVITVMEEKGIMIRGSIDR